MGNKMVKLDAYDLERFATTKYDKIYDKMDSQERRYMTSLKNILKEKDPELLAKLILSLHHSYVLDRNYDKI